MERRYMVSMQSSTPRPSRNLALKQAIHALDQPVCPPPFARRYSSDFFAASNSGEPGRALSPG